MLQPMEQLMSMIRFLTTTILTVTIAGNAYAQTAAMSKADIQAIVKETLMNEPAIIMEALEKLRQQKADEAQQATKAAIDKNKSELLNSSAPFIGPADADVTIVEFFDYHCGYCKHFLAEINKLVAADKKVRVVFKDMPILSEDSVTAARAAIAVNRIAKDKFFAFHTALMAEKGRFDEVRLMDIAKSVGVDANKLKTEMTKPEITAELDRNRKVAEELGVRGTPALVIGKELIPGAASFEELQKYVAAARTAQ